MSGAQHSDSAGMDVPASAVLSALATPTLPARGGGRKPGPGEKEKPWDRTAAPGGESERNGPILR